jgi:hypothetical protein
MQPKQVVIECPYCHAVQSQYWDKNPLGHHTYFICVVCGLTEPIAHHIVHVVKRTPKLGWNQLTTLEALADSAKTTLGMNNKEGTMRTLHKILTILRNTITRSKSTNLIPVCETRETPRTRCNQSPVFLVNGHFTCEKHIK